MNVEINTLYQVITDFEHYPEFVSEVVGAKTLPGSTDTRALVRFELEIIKRFEYLLEFKMTRPTEVKWKLTRSNFFKVNDGAWSLTPVDASHTEAHYELEVGFGFLVPGWVSRKLTEINLPQMFDHFEARAKALS